MKSYSGHPEVVQYNRLVVPSGNKFPRAPVGGEIFHLEVDMPADANPLLPWYTRGAHVFNGVDWDKLNDVFRFRRADPIGSRCIEVDEKGMLDSPKSPPHPGRGFLLSTVIVQPSNVKASFSGSASLWVDVSEDCAVWIAIFRGQTLAGLSAAVIDAGKPQTMHVSFYDMPHTRLEQTYTLKMYTERMGLLFINQCKRFNFDGASQTAFIVAENT